MAKEKDTKKQTAIDKNFCFAIIKVLISLRSGSQDHDRSFVL